MHIKQILKSGSPSTLFSAFIYFDISFMIWVMLGPLGNFIAEDFLLTAGQKGLMTAMPLLTGSLLAPIDGGLKPALQCAIAATAFGPARQAQRRHPT